MNKFTTCILPLAVFFGILIADRPFPNFLPGLTGSEFGLVETLHNVCLLLAVLASFRLFFLKNETAPKWIKAWIAIGFIGSLYVFLEEISYGQHYFGWITPESWGALNDQNETNIHNTSSWFDQKPRLLLEIGIIVGGILIPILQKYKPTALPTQFEFIYPTKAFFITAVIGIFVRLQERIVSALGHNDWLLFSRASEMQELYFYYFTLLYFILLRERFKNKA